MEAEVGGSSSSVQLPIEVLSLTSSSTQSNIATAFGGEDSEGALQSVITEGGASLSFYGNSKMIAPVLTYRNSNKDTIVFFETDSEGLLLKSMTFTLDTSSDPAVYTSVEVTNTPISLNLSVNPSNTSNMNVWIETD